jgi:tyrosyl-tRNA synthetase
MQGYDSVELKADIELGGSDQTFNLLMGRTLQEQYQLEGQCILTMPLLEGLDGSAKMSKSYGNTIGLTESPDQAFGKLMSISDTLMWRYFRLLLNKTDDEIAQYQSAVAHGTSHPMELKKEMAFAIIKRFWGNNAAHDGLAAFETLFQKKDLSAAKEYRLDDTTPVQMPIIDLMRHVGACDTNSEARRLIAAGAVSIDQEKITDIQTVIDTSTPHTLRVGKHKFYQLIR